VNPPGGGGYGTSKRTERRDRFTAANVKSRDELIQTLESNVAELEHSLTARPSVQEFETSQTQLKEAKESRDRFFTERDEARSELHRVGTRKRRLEEENERANRRVHDMHGMLSRVLPLNVPRTCPCAACSR
jgi:uncharacterized protein (DUF3084 family)